MKQVAEFATMKRPSAACLTSTNGQNIIYGCVEEKCSIHSRYCTGCISKLLQGEMCQLSINKMTQLIMKNMSAAAMGFWTYFYLSPAYIHRDNLEVHRYFSICVEQTFCLLCKLFLSIRQTEYPGLRGLQ